MQQRLEQLRLEEERRKQEEEEKQRALEEAENRRLEKVFIFLCHYVSRCKGENWLAGVLCNFLYNGATGSFLNLTQHAHKGSTCT